MSKNNVVEIIKRDTIRDDALTEMLRAGAQQLIHQVVQAELAVFRNSRDISLTPCTIK